MFDNHYTIFHFGQHAKAWLKASKPLPKGSCHGFSGVVYTTVAYSISHVFQPWAKVSFPKANNVVVNDDYVNHFHCNGS